MKFAFFDVDETLIHPKSMFAFMEFWYARIGNRDQYENVMRELRQLADSGAERGAVNRLYYRQYAGVDIAELFAAGREWYHAASATGSLFKTVVVNRLRALASDGFTAVFVSGSMRPVLEPIAIELDVSHLLCAELECVENICTGRLQDMAIGVRKRERLLDFVGDHDAGDQAHHAYGDHISDLPMLLAVDHPHVVDPCAALREVAVQRGWPVMTAAKISLP